MPVFFQQDIDHDTKLAIWKIEEDEDFFLKHVILNIEINHPHKRLQHLAGRFLLKYLFPAFPISLIQIADTRKPFLKDEEYHFSISHCGDYAAAIVSKTKRVGIDIEIPSEKVDKIKHKFLHDEERQMLDQWLQNELPTTNYKLLTLLWSAKEAMFKWWGLGKVEFKEMLRVNDSIVETKGCFDASFIKDEENVPIKVHYTILSELVISWVMTEV